MPEGIVIIRTALLLALVVASVALVVWLLRPKVRRQLDDAAMIPWREEERRRSPPAAPNSAPRREDGR